MAKIQIRYHPNIAWQGEFQLLESDGITPTDITGATFRMHVRKTIDELDIIALASTANGKIQITGAGSITVNLDSTDTLAMATANRKTVADIEVAFPSGNIMPEIVEIDFTTNKSITRDYDTN